MLVVPVAHEAVRWAEDDHTMERRDLQNVSQIEKMKIQHGAGKTEYGPGVSIELSGNEVANAIGAWLVAHNVYVSGPRTITVNGDLCKVGEVYVDPSGFVIAKGKKVSGRGKGT